MKRKRHVAGTKRTPQRPRRAPRHSVAQPTPRVRAIVDSPAAHTTYTGDADLTCSSCGAPPYTHCYTVCTSDDPLWEISTSATLAVRQ